jgi:hypothetical protein
VSLLLSEDVLKYREYEVDVAVDLMKKVMACRDSEELIKLSGYLEAVKMFIDLPKRIATTTDEQIYAKELIGKTKDLLANKIAGKYLFEP